MKITQAVGGFFIPLREGCFWKIPQRFPLLVRYLIYFKKGLAELEEKLCPKVITSSAKIASSILRYFFCARAAVDRSAFLNQGTVICTGTGAFSVLKKPIPCNSVPPHGASGWLNVTPCYGVVISTPLTKGSHPFTYYRGINLWDFSEPFDCASRSNHPAPAFSALKPSHFGADLRSLAFSLHPTMRDSISFMVSRRAA